MAVGDMIRNSQVWKSIFRHPAPRDRRNRVVVMLTNVFLHLHPVSVRKSGINLSYTWCMGGITFFLFLVETVTGVLLMLYYRPTLEHAYNDILSLRDVPTPRLALLDDRRRAAHSLGQRRALRTLGRPLRRRDGPPAFLRASLCRPAAGRGPAHRHPLLARAQRRRHQRSVIANDDRWFEGQWR